MIEVAVKCARECRSVKYAHRVYARNETSSAKSGVRCRYSSSLSIVVVVHRRRRPSIVAEGIKKGNKRNEGKKRREK